MSRLRRVTQPANRHGPRGAVTGRAVTGLATT